MRGLLDDYAFTSIACLDAYEVTGAISYFRFAQKIADEMIRRFADQTSGGFFDTEASLEDRLQLGSSLGAPKAIPGRTDTGRKSQRGDCPASSARLHQRRKYRDKAEDTLEVFAGCAEQFGIYAGTYGIAATWMSRPHTQVVVVGEDEKAAALLKAASAIPVNKSVVHLTDSEAVAQNLPPVLAETIPNLPATERQEVAGGAVYELHLPAAAGRSRPIGSLVARDGEPGDVICAPHSTCASRHSMAQPTVQRYYVNSPSLAI